MTSTERYKTLSLADFLMKRFIGLSVEGLPCSHHSSITNCKSSPNFAIPSQGRVLGHSNKKRISNSQADRNLVFLQLVLLNKYNKYLYRMLNKFRR